VLIKVHVAHDNPLLRETLASSLAAQPGIKIVQMSPEGEVGLGQVDDRRTDVLVLAVPPLALVDEEMLDHAGHWETALMLALHPRMVDLSTLDPAPLYPASSAVLGADPRRATAGQGESALRLATERIFIGVQSLLRHGGPAVLHELYARRRAGYQQYVDRYFRGSWEEAIETWWGEKKLVKS